MRILITGGAGFVGSQLALLCKQAYPNAHILAFDNLHRRGSETNLPLFKEQGITFVHGDIRQPGDLNQLPGNYDLMIEASAEPSVLAGLTGSPDYLIHTNLTGTVNCLEFARRRADMLMFLSTSRVYSIAPLSAVALKETDTRFEIDARQTIPGVSAKGIAEHFPHNTARSLYGATKLASEIMVQEYVHTYGLKAVINRCGVIAGPGQFGKTDQGVFTLWVAHHILKKPLKYTGFGGLGEQVRDLLHPKDLFDLLQKQLAQIEKVSGQIYNIGGGREISTSLSEFTTLCQAISGNRLAIGSDKETAPVDIPLYITDYSRAQNQFGWKPLTQVEEIVEEIAKWITNNRATLASIFN